MPVRVFRVAHQALGLVVVRLVLALGGLVASIVAGAEPGPAAAGVAFGAGVTAVALISDRRWLLSRRPSLGPLPEGATGGGLAKGVATGLLPSTIGVAALLAVSLAFEPILGAVLAGVIAGMGLVGLMGLTDLIIRERREGARVYADEADSSRRYVG